MKLAPKEFVVLEEAELTDDEDFKTEYEFDEQDDFEVEIEATGDEPEVEVEEEDLGLAEVDDDRVKATQIFTEIVEGKRDYADKGKEAAREITAASKGMFTPSSKPYSVHPSAAAKDALFVANENNKTLAKKFEEINANVDGDARSIGAHIRRVLYAKAVAMKIRDQRRGKLDARKLHTLNLPGQIKPNRRVFEKKTESKTQDVIIGILVDESGSMAGQKILVARRAALVLGEALNSIKPLGVEFCVWGFTTAPMVRVEHGEEYDRVEPLQINVYKSPSENWSRVKTRVAAIDARANNVDGECVRWAAQQLILEKAARRILIVISDGLPAATYSRTGAPGFNKDLALAIKQSEEAGVEISAVGLMSTAVNNFYKNKVVVFREEQLSTALMEMVGKYFGVQ